MNYYIYLADIMKDISRVVDYLMVGLPHHTTSYFWLGDGNGTFTLGGGGNRN